MERSFSLFCLIETGVVEEKLVEEVDYKVLFSILSNSDFSAVYNESNVNIAYNNLYDIINLALLDSTSVIKL